MDLAILTQMSSPLLKLCVNPFQMSSLKFRAGKGLARGLEPGSSPDLSYSRACALASEPPALFWPRLCASHLVKLCLHFPKPCMCCVH